MLSQRLQKLAYALKSAPARYALLHSRVVPSTELRGLLEGIRPATVVDIGANAGQFTLLSLLELRATRVFAFEPLSAPARRFRTAMGRDARVTLYQLAIGPVREAADMHVSASDDSSSLRPIGRGQTDAFPKTEEVGLERVAVVPLTDVLDAADLAGPTLLKVDVQGFELEVLQSSADLLWCFSWVLVEASFEILYEGQALAGDVIAFLMEHGFTLLRVRTTNSVSKRIPVQADFLFKRAASGKSPP